MRTGMPVQADAASRANAGAHADTNLQADAILQANTTAQSDANAQVDAASQAAAAPSAVDIAAQSIMAGTIQNSAANASRPNPMATPQDGVDAADAVAPNAAPAAAVAALASHPVAATAGTAARLASNAQVVPDLAGVSASDGRGHVGAANLSAGIPIDASAGAAQAAAGTAASASIAPSPALNVTARVDSPAFGQAVADRVSLMVDSNLTSAKLQVNPPALGPVEVRIALQAGHAQVWLMSHSAVTRDALESSSPKLKEMLGQQGFSQVSVDISQRSFQDRAPPSRGYEATAPDGGTAVSAANATAIPAVRAASSLLDAYA
jgi:flagellar hook-length control protein FliK